jgi:hypothetical protein
MIGMDEDEILKRIETLRARKAHAEETFARALAVANAQCLAALQSLCDVLVKIQAKVPEAQLLKLPVVYKGCVPHSLPIDSPKLWHACDIEDSLSNRIIVGIH